MKILSIVLACLLMQTAAAQDFPNIYRDVMALRKTMSDGRFLRDASSREVYSSILRRYFEPQGKDSPENIEEQIINSGNPFRIASMFMTADAMIRKDKDNHAAPTFISPGVSPIAPETVVAAAAGSGAPLITSAITSLVIKRAKQELTVVFFNKLKEELNRQAGLQRLFPKTAALISQIEPYLYAGFLNTLRAAFAEDINGLVSAVPAYLRLPDIADSSILKDPSRHGQWLSVPILDALGSLFTGSSLADAIQKLHPGKPVIQTGKWGNVYNTLEFLCMLSEAVRDESGSRDWISVGDFSKNIIENQVNTRLFYGLLYEKIRSVCFTKKDGTALKLTEVITYEPERINALNNSIRILLQGYNQAATVLDSLQTMGLMAEVSYQKTIGLMTRISTTTKNTCTQINRLISLADAGYTAKTDSLFKHVSTLTTLAGNLYEQQYAAAIMNSTVLLDRYLPSKENITGQLIKYGSFAASLIEAKNENDISNALDAAILPTGSSSIKQYTGWSVSINSYIGANWYTEKYKSTSIANTTTRFPTFGISLPIGVAFTKGLRNTSIGKVVGAVSLFASILDLGSVASYQLSTPDSITSKQLPDFTWKNLLAPGGFVVLGRLFNTPLSLGFGLQKGPALRSIRYGSGSTSIDLSDQLNWRSGIFLAVDIPFFNLYSKPYTKSGQ